MNWAKEKRNTQEGDKAAKKALDQKKREMSVRRREGITLPTSIFFEIVKCSYNYKTMFGIARQARQKKTT